MLKKGNTKLVWSTTSTDSFHKLKSLSAPILHHPNPEREFLVEVDASSTGIRAILSQCQGNPSKLFPCAHYSRKLTPTEQNYDVGDRELLAMKAALEQWRHWLEGSKHPFIVLTDHRNLEYLRSAKRLNPAKPDGLCSSFGSSSLLPTDPVPRTPRPMLSHANTSPLLHRHPMNPFYLPPSFSHQFNGTS